MIRNSKIYINQILSMIKGWAFIIIIMFFSNEEALASHIRASDIKMVHISGQTYQVIVAVYTDINGVSHSPGLISFGDGSDNIVIESPNSRESVSFDTEKQIFSTTHTFPTPGTYRVGFLSNYRNASIVNISSPTTTSLYVETIINTLQINPNSTPELTIPPVEMAAIGQRYIHNAGAIDAEGDSLSYELITPRSATNINVVDYKTPINFSTQKEDGSVPSLFSINPITGDLIWDAPMTKGDFNVAFTISEWRNGVKISQTVRDLQIMVRENPNLRPNIADISDTCVIANTIISKTIETEDTDKHFVTLTSSGEPYNKGATFLLDNLQPPNGKETGDFEWQTDCFDVREASYQTFFKSDDEPTPIYRTLTDIKTWNIKVTAPAPDIQSLDFDVNAKKLTLKWNNYICPNIENFRIYRKIGSNDFNTDCIDTEVKGGYQLLAEVDKNQLQYVDNSISLGKEYCYKITTTFPAPGYGESLVSSEKCFFIPTIAPIITNVDVENTSLQGSINIKWHKHKLDPAIHTAPYTYQLIRKTIAPEGIKEELLTNIFSENDTTFLDQDINTITNIHEYRVVLYSNGQVVDTSSTATNVSLELTEKSNSFELQWKAEVPWSLQNRKFYHYIFRKEATETTYNLIDSVSTGDNGLFYLDDDEILKNGVEYCYYISTTSTYNTTDLADSLINKSHEKCALLLDITPPCTPLVSLQQLDCSVFETNTSLYCNNPYENITLSWEDGDCGQDDISYYNIYFSAKKEGNYTLISTTVDKTYTHFNPNLSGCYKVTSVDFSGNESLAEKIVCHENCPFFEVPNIITINNDGKNDFFVPKPCPAYIENLSFQIYNRWGDLLVSEVNSTSLTWNGKVNNQYVSSGIYYYNIQVTFIGIDDNKKQIKGWIHVIR